MRPHTLSAARLHAYLDRLGGPDVSHDAMGLAALQAAHLMAVPFHNLQLLVNDGRPYELQPIEAAIDEAIAGVGGNCDRTTPPFTALLQALGFDAELAAATIGAPGDHFVCLVRLNGRRYLCDVGNGHPYLQPWDLDGPVQTQAFNGWRFSFDPHGPNGPTLRRHLDADHVKTVYTVDVASRAYSDFAPMVRSHYTRAGFGPFLSGLRAVRLQRDLMLTLRDNNYTRHTRFGRFTRPVRERVAAESLLVERFGLPPVMVEGALNVATRRQPELFGPTPTWVALGRGRIRESEGVSPPTAVEVPDVLISLATVGRSASVNRLLQTLSAEIEASRYPGQVGVLIVENHVRQHAVYARPEHLPVHTMPISDLMVELERSAQAGVLPTPSSLEPVPIGLAREAQLIALRRHLDTPIPELPHPAQRPTVVWMVDDDMAFEQLGPDGQPRRHTHLLHRVARMWATMPERSVILGTFTGDPPVPGLDTLGGQLRDLTANVALMMQLGPETPWAPPTQPAPYFDAYYDLSEAPPPPSEAVWPFAPHLAGRTTREVALTLLGDLGRLLDGQQITRPLTWVGGEMHPRPSARRGGNALFLDLDTLFRWPTPAVDTEDGVVTRRADTLWAILAQRDEPGAVVEATLPLLHGRARQATPLPSATQGAEAEARQAAAQVRGVALTRALAHGRPIDETLRERERRVAEQRGHLQGLIAELRACLLTLGAWGDAEIDRALADGLQVLHLLELRARQSIPTPGDAGALETFLKKLPEAIDAWRRRW